MPIGEAFRARDLQEKNNASFIHHKQMALSSVSSLIYKNKYVSLAWVEGEAGAPLTRSCKKKRSGRLHKATSTQKDNYGEAAGAAQALPAVESVSPALLGTMATPLPSAIMCSCVRRLAFFRSP